MTTREASLILGLNKWTDKEHALFRHAVKLHGKDFKKIQKMVSSKTLHQVMKHSENLVKAFQKKEYHKDSDLLEILEPSLKIKWTTKEKEDFIEAIE